MATPPLTARRRRPGVDSEGSGTDGAPAEALEHDGGARARLGGDQDGGAALSLDGHVARRLLADADAKDATAQEPSRPVLVQREDPDLERRARALHDGLADHAALGVEALAGEEKDDGIRRGDPLEVHTGD